MKMLLKILFIASIITFNWHSAAGTEATQDWRVEHLAAGGMLYPVDPDLSPLKPLKMKIIQKLYKETEKDIANEVYHYDIPKFFKNGESLSVAETREKVGCKIIFSKWNGYNVEFNLDNVSVHGFKFFPVQIYDLDGNGLTDIKMLCHLYGNSGNSNVAMVFYFYQFPTEWRMVGFFLRDPLYSWECDLDGDGVYELLKGHH